jgi:hypothetical protein
MSIIPHEMYIITLQHEYISSEGVHYQLDDPIQVSQITYTAETGKIYPSSSTIINEMLDRMCHYLLRKVSEEGWEK